MGRPTQRSTRVQKARRVIDGVRRRRTRYAEDLAQVLGDRRLFLGRVVLCGAGRLVFVTAVIASLLQSGQSSDVVFCIRTA
jgi:hypothetical protein